MRGIVEWRACRISDPVGRLRYLRRLNHARRNSKTAFALAACFALILIPRPAAHQRVFPAAAKDARSLASPPRVWIVEDTSDHEIYSNGLRIENRWRTESEPRARFAAFPLDDPQLTSAIWLSNPVGIVFHSTESEPAPFVEDRTAELLRQSEGTLAYVRSRRAYHFLIDRFGRVFRIVPESGIAFHAGESVWADHRFLYPRLNAGFLGVAFDTHTGAQPELTPAQVSAARELVEMLRARYAIPAEDCVTHAQVSINRNNREIGWHTDFAASFPFEAIGLQGNESLPPASLYVAGFDYDPRFLRAAGPALLRGVDLAEGILHRNAVGFGLSDARYRRLLAQRFLALSRSFE